jgi:hypothetical protein
MSVIYGSAAAPVVYGSHYGVIAGSGYFSRKQLKRAIKYGSYLGGAALGAPVVAAPVVPAPLYDVESRYYFEGGYRSSKHYAPYFHHYAPHIGGIDVSSAVSSAPSTVTTSPSEAVASKAKALLERFEGCEDFKSKMQQLERSAAELRKMGHPVDGLLSNWLFVGEPGTGMVAPSASLRVLAGVTWPSHLFTCFLLYLASILAFSLPALKYDVQYSSSDAPVRSR